MAVECPLHPNSWPSIKLKDRPGIPLSAPFQIPQLIVEPFEVEVRDVIPQFKVILLFLATLPSYLIPATLPSPYALPSTEVIDLQLTLIVALWVRMAYCLLVVQGITNRLVYSPEGRDLFVLLLHLFLHADCSAEATQHLSVFGYQDTFSQDRLKGGYYRLIERGAPQEHDSLAYLLVSHNPVQVVVDNGIAEAGDEIIFVPAFLGIGDEVGLHKHSTSFGQFNGIFREEGYVLKFPNDVYAVFICQLMKKAPRSSCAYLVHVEVKGMGVGNGDVLAVLSPYFKDSID